MAIEPHTKEVIFELWQGGHTASEIARIVGDGVSRSAVCGVVHRARSKGEDLKVRVVGRASRPFVLPGPGTKATRTPPKPVVRATPEPPARCKDDGSFVGTLDLGEHDCRWPIGEVRASDFHYCANAQRAGSPYCEHHAGRAWERRKKNAAGTSEVVDGDRE